MSSETMQSIWAKILAGETNEPGSFSKVVIDVVAGLSKYDAILFTNFCGMLWTINGNEVPIIYNILNPIVVEYKIDGLALEHLERLGLIKVYSEPQVKMRVSSGVIYSVSYYGKLINIEVPHEITSISLGSYILTRSGRDLAKISGAKPSEAYFLSILEEWVNQRYIVSSPWPSK